MLFNMILYIDTELVKIYKKVAEGLKQDFLVQINGGLYFKDRLCNPNDPNLKKILDERYKSRYIVHPGSTKMYRNLKTKYWWNNLKH